MTFKPNKAAEIAAYLRTSVQKASQNQRVGPFWAMFDADSDNRYRNYAISDDEAEPNKSDVSDLIEAFRVRGRVPRLEYIEELSPGVRPSLESAGFTVEGRLSLMNVSQDQLVWPSINPEFSVLMVSGDQDLRAAAGVQNASYGEAQTSQADVDRLRRLVTRGGGVALARLVGSQEPIGAGLYAAPTGDLSEVAAVGVLADYRRRGVGALVTAVLTADALAKGCSAPFLMAAHEGERRMYARVGYRDCGSMLHIAL